VKPFSMLTYTGIRAAWIQVRFRLAIREGGLMKVRTIVVRMAATMTAIVMA
jgi:hypothetical protein